MKDRHLNILFLCTGNSARSILGEALVNHLGQSHGGTVRGFSAGSTPVGAVNPVALEVLQAKGLSVEGLRSKSWDEFATAEAPAMDIILTVCDNAANEACPIWPGHPATAHWGLPDPAGVPPGDGDDLGDRQVAFEAIFHILQDRLARLLGSGVVSKGDAELRRVLRDLGGVNTDHG